MTVSKAGDSRVWVKDLAKGDGTEAEDVRVGMNGVKHLTTTSSTEKLTSHGIHASRMLCKCAVVDGFDHCILPWQICVVRDYLLLHL